MNKTSGRVAALSIAGALAIFLIDIMIPLGVADSVPHIFVVLTAARHPDNRFTIRMAICCSVLTVLGFFLSPPGGELWKVLFNRTIALFAIWVTAVLILQRKNQEENAARAFAEREKAMSEIKVLKGFLPICASCKRIRDEKGAWHVLETYIDSHSEATFSHSVCPGCVQKLYPDLLDKGG